MQTIRAFIGYLPLRIYKRIIIELSSNRISMHPTRKKLLVEVADASEIPRQIHHGALTDVFGLRGTLKDFLDRDTYGIGSIVPSMGPVVQFAKTGN
jgi:hypothetical protein